jgi:glutathione S-transferase
MITLYGFSRVIDAVVGSTRDLRALWTLEETGLPYRVHGLDFIKGDLKSDEYRRLSPFQQVPALDDDGFIVAESAAVVTYIAEKAGKLIPSDLQGRTRVNQWSFAAMNTVEPTVLQIGFIDFFGDKDPTGKVRRPKLVETADRWFEALERELTMRPYLASESFTVADILMTTVLRAAQKASLLEQYPIIQAYASRCQGRPAWTRTLAEYERRLGVAPGTASR